MADRLIHGTTYHEKTSQQILEILENLRKSRKLVRIFYGNVETGQAWQEENSVGVVSRSGGTVKIPILVPENDIGGGAISSDCIVKIVELTSAYKTRKVVYQHPNFYQPVYEARELERMFIRDGVAYGFEVVASGKQYSCHSTLKEAQNLASFMNGATHKLLGGCYAGSY